MDLDLTCTARLEIYDREREKRQLEAMSGGLLMSALGQGVATVTPKKTVREGTF